MLTHCHWATGHFRAESSEISDRENAIRHYYKAFAKGGHYVRVVSVIILNVPPMYMNKVLSKSQNPDHQAGSILCLPGHVRSYTLPLIYGSLPAVKLSKYWLTIRNESWVSLYDFSLRMNCDVTLYIFSLLEYVTMRSCWRGVRAHGEARGHPQGARPYVPSPKSSLIFYVSIFEQMLQNIKFWSKDLIKI